MNALKKKINRQKRTRAKISGTGERPRLSVFRSNSAIYAQLIDDQKGITIAGISEKNIEAKGTKSEKSKQLGIHIAKLAKEKKINLVVFDRGRYKYHGRVKAVAEGAREGGLEF